MSVKPHLQTSLSQRLVLTPQMRQRIEMLQMTKLELSDMIVAEIEQNPVLDTVEPGESSDEATDGNTEEEPRVDRQTAATHDGESPDRLENASTSEGAADR